MHNLVCRFKHQKQHYYDSMRKRQKEQRIQANYVLLIMLLYSKAILCIYPVRLPGIVPELNLHTKSTGMEG